MVQKYIGMTQNVVLWLSLVSNNNYPSPASRIFEQRSPLNEFNILMMLKISNIGTGNKCHSEENFYSLMSQRPYKCLILVNFPLKPLSY